MSRRLDDDLLVYDLERNKAHCLNASAALVYELCDGERSLEDLARAVAERLAIEEAGPIVTLALARLADAHLLEGEVPAKRVAAPVTRRTVLKQMKTAAALLPVVASVMAPTVASAGSTITTTTCSMRSQPNCGVGISKCDGGMTFCKKFGAMGCSCQ